MTWYDNSPQLVDDIPPIKRESEPSEQKTGQKPAEPKTDAQLPEAIQQLRADPARKFYDDSKMYSGVKIGIVPEGASDELRQVVETTNREMASIFADLSCSTQEAQQFVDMIFRAAQNPPTPQQRQEWERTTQRDLQQEFGPRYQEAITDAARLAMRDPRVWNAIVAAGLTESPQMVKWLVNKARSEKSRGRLSPKRG